MSRVPIKLLMLPLLAVLAVSERVAAQQPPPPIKVVLWFDAEDYILPEDDDATRRLAEMLTRLGVKATFKVVGEKARVLEQRGRTDVIAALKLHEIGYHSNTHSQQPTIAVYLQNAGWDDGRAEFERREGQGSRDVARIFGRTPVAYGQPGSAWAPQSYPALRAMGIGMYLDEADHVGIDDQPFYYGGMLNVFKMRSTLARMALDGTDLSRARRDSRQSPTRCAREAAAPSASTITRRNGSTPSSGMRSTSAAAQTRRARTGSGRGPVRPRKPRRPSRTSSNTSASSRSSPA